MAERLNTTLMENLITLLCYDDQNGKIVANMLEPGSMEGDYRVVAERAVDYWRNYNTAPKDHTPDIVADIIEDKNNRRASSVKRILRAMHQIAGDVNSNYVMNQLRTFQRLQRIKAAIIESAEKVNNNQHMALDEIERIWYGILRTQEKDFQPGMRLSDIGRVVSRLEKLQDEFKTGIGVLDRRYVVPARGQLFMLLAAAGRGKTWGLIHIGKAALAARKKVVHLSLEVDEEIVAQRYYQSMMRVSKREEEIEYTVVDYDMDRIESIDRATTAPSFTWHGSTILQDELVQHMTSMGVGRFNNLIIKRFPPHHLTVAGINAYLDTLEQTENFIPDMLIIDYPGIMKLDKNNIRQSLGQTVTEIRGLLIERDIAGVAAHQGSKAGEEAQTMKSTHVAEDWSVVGTVDTLVTYSQTELEFRYGLARLFVAKARTEEDRFGALITQSYKMGQFCLQSHLLDSRYFEKLDDLSTGDDDEISDGEGE